MKCQGLICSTGGYNYQTGNMGNLLGFLILKKGQQIGQKEYSLGIGLQMIRLSTTITWY